MAKRARGAATRDRLLAATRAVVREVGYAHATTRAIAEAAGVAEGTIYRHFPNKVALFFSAVLEQDHPVLREVQRLPQTAGTNTVTENLTAALQSLATLREQMLPLELAMLTDPELAAMRDKMEPTPREFGVDPPASLVEYLRAEQKLGRVRADVECQQAVPIMLGALFGVAILPTAVTGGVDSDLVRQTVSLFVDGLAP